MKVLLVASSRKPQGASLLESIHRFLKEHGVTVVGAFLLDGIQQKDPSFEEYFRKVDLVVSIGGDGSLLMLAHKIGLPPPPFVGINLGSLGFLAEIPANSITTGLANIIQGAYEKTSRIIIEGKITRKLDSSCLYSFAINECTLHRGSQPNLIDIAIHVDGIYLNTFSCDGVIISTPSGSTAYSLAAGGPILTPELNALVITPICPHTISNKPIVLLPKKSITLECVRGGAFCDLSFDGQENFQIEKNDLIEITVSPHRFDTLSPHSVGDYFHTVRTKLGWTGSLRQ